ncbi:hypothetical protein HNR19_001366 [Nocardioides thalensis]|uniref:Uncharacterized protein n=1 Tax=Nocardioides thalensis TaxID=1914755 RepID=A0A853C253_9ACTN|nr:hypothetical protein [Nocardioides thalensis]NYJ00668.1 hypothetical protein [Nocardioides thalensis]
MVVWIAALVALAAVLAFVTAVSRSVLAPAWPDEAPLQVRESRAVDQQLPHLARLVAAEDPTAAHRIVREVTADLLAAAHLSPADLDPRVAAFLADPPLASPARYRAELAAVLERIERL